MGAESSESLLFPLPFLFYVHVVFLQGQDQMPPMLLSPSAFVCSVTCHCPFFGREHVSGSQLGRRRKVVPGTRVSRSPRLLFVVRFFP